MLVQHYGPRDTLVALTLAMYSNKPYPGVISIGRILALHLLLSCLCVQLTLYLSIAQFQLTTASHVHPLGVESWVTHVRLVRKP